MSDDTDRCRGRSPSLRFFRFSRVSWLIARSKHPTCCYAGFTSVPKPSSPTWNRLKREEIRRSAQSCKVDVS